MRVLVCGGRNYNEKAEFDLRMDELSQSLQKVICIIQGGADGADTLARHWAMERMLPVMTFPANWSRLGREAGPIRNEWMLDYGQPDLVVAFPGGRGTANMVKLAEAAGIEVIRYE